MNDDIRVGDLAIRTRSGGQTTLSLLVPGCNWHGGAGRNWESTPHFHHATGGYDRAANPSSLGTTYRRAIVLDPESEADRQRLLSAMGCATPEAAMRGLLESQQEPARSNQCLSRVTVLGRTARCQGVLGHDGDHHTEGISWNPLEVPF